MVGDAYGASLVAHVSKAELEQLDLERAEFEAPNVVPPSDGEPQDIYRDQCILSIDSDDEETAMQTETDVKPTGLRTDTEADIPTESGVDNDSGHGEGGREDIEDGEPEPEVTNNDDYSWFGAALFFG